MSCFLVRYLISTGSDQRPEDEPAASRFSSVRVWIKNKVRPVPLIDTKQPYKPGCVIYRFMKRLKQLMVVLVTLLVFLYLSSDENVAHWFWWFTVRDRVVSREFHLLITELQDHPDHLQVCFRRSEVRLDPAAELDHTLKKFSCFCEHVDPERPPTENQRTTESFSVDLTDTSGVSRGNRLKSRKSYHFLFVLLSPTCSQSTSTPVTRPLISLIRPVKPERSVTAAPLHLTVQTCISSWWPGLL